MPELFRFPDDYSAAPGAISGTMRLDGRLYFFRFLPNTRANDGNGGYTVDLGNVLGQPVLLGVKLVLSTDLFGCFRTIVDDVPPGRVVVRRTDGINTDPEIYDRSVYDEPTLLPGPGGPEIVVEYVTVAEDENSISTA